MNYLGLGVVGRAGARLYSSCKDLYNDLNGANLTGAVDIVVVKQLDGTYKATPFHVRFGKFGVLRTGDLQKEVEVEVNGEPVSNRMMLDESGMAFFVKPKHSLSTDPSTDSIYEPHSHSFDSISDPIYRLAEVDCVELIINDKSGNGSPEESLTSDHLSLEPDTSSAATGGTVADNETTSTDDSSTFIDTGLTGICIDSPSVDYSIEPPGSKLPNTVDTSKVTESNGISSLAIIDNEVLNNPGNEPDNEPGNEQCNDVTSAVINDIVPVLDGDTVDGGIIMENKNLVSSLVIDDVPVTNDGIESDIVNSNVLNSDTTHDGVIGDTADHVICEDVNDVLPPPCDHTVSTVPSQCSTSDDCLYKQQSVENNCIPRDKPFFTPTDDPNEFEWLVNKNNIPNNTVSDLTTDLDSGVLSDSALELHKSAQKYCHVNEAHSDSELDERKEKTKGEVTPPYTMTEVNTDRQPISNNSMPPSHGLWSALTGIWSRRKRRRFSSVEEGIYLDELDNGGLKDEEKALYLPGPSPELKMSASANMEDLCDSSSGIDTSSQQSSPVRGLKSDQNIEDIIGMLSDITVSQCGWDDPITEESFNRSQISFDDFCNDISLLSSNNTVIRIGEKYYNWLVAGPMIMSALLYQRHLPMNFQKDLERHHVYKNMVTKTRPPSKKSRWSIWSKEAAAEAKFGELDQPQNSITTIFEAPPTTVTPIFTTANTNVTKPILKMSQSLPPPRSIDDDLISSDEEVENERSLPRVRQRSLRRKRLIFTNELTSEELSLWPLKSGKNELVFSITTKYQGTAKASCSLYLWNHDEKVVVSDFDGTITRSDVAGQVLPFLGKDWTHFGVIELFSAIHDNGYRLLYLSARAIGQSMYTKNYLRNTRSRNCSLPDGPLLVTPFSLYKAFKKEVIERKPEEFKILCLQQIRDFFPENYNPFHAGFGNKSSDAKSYLEVEIPSSRIFTVNPKGEIKNELTWTFQSSYTGLMEFVDAQFPHISKPQILSSGSNSDCDGAETNDTDISSSMLDENFSSFAYWQKSFNSFGSFNLPDL